MARGWQTLTWVTLWTTGLSVAPQPAAQPSRVPADAGAPFEADAKPGQRMSSRGRAEKPAPSKDPAAAQKEVEAGIASAQAGQTEIAVQRFTAALSGGSLPSAQKAKALFHRGVAFRQQGNPVQAIADLTSALWFKGGLSDSDRADALETRAAAYRDAGLPDQVDQVDEEQKLAAAGASSTDDAAASAEPSGVVLGNFFGSLFGGTSSGPAMQTGSLADSPPAPTSGGWVDGTQVRNAEQ